MDLTTKQKTYLRGLAQTLRAQLHLGHEGCTPGTLSALEDLFRGREMVKVRVLKTADEDPKQLAEGMAQASGASLVGVVGGTFVLYRPNADLKERIELPAASSPDETRPGAGQRPGPGRRVPPP
jgi:RNA-binding protein